MKKIVALICTHNGERFIKEQIESIINQSVLVDYIYVYDFNSSDATVEIVQNLCEKFDNIGLFVNDFAISVSHSFYFAIGDIIKKIEKNSYIYLCDQDDVWFDNKNEIIQENLQKLSYPNLIHHDVELVDGLLNNLNKSFYKKNHAELLKSSEPISTVFSVAIGHTMLISYDLAKSFSMLSFNNNIIMHDWLISIIAEYKYERKFLDLKLSKYRQHDKNVLGASPYDRNFQAKFSRTLSNIKLINKQLKYLISERIFVNHFLILTLIRLLIKSRSLKNISILFIILVMRL